MHIIKLLAFSFSLRKSSLSIQYSESLQNNTRLKQKFSTSLFWASIHIFNYEVSSLITFVSCVNSSVFSDRRLFLVTLTFRSRRGELCSVFADCEVSDSSEVTRSGRAGWLKQKKKQVSCHHITSFSHIFMVWNYMKFRHNLDFLVW